LLQLVATRLEPRLPDGEILARMGGDEFAVLMERVAQPQVAAERAQALIEALKEVFVLAGGRKSILAVRPEGADH
jgi:GGDEF domain-containing protein